MPAVTLLRTVASPSAQQEREDDEDEVRGMLDEACRAILGAYASVKVRSVKGG